MWGSLCSTLVCSSVYTCLISLPTVFDTAPVYTCCCFHCFSMFTWPAFQLSAPCSESWAHNGGKRAEQTAHYLELYTGWCHLRLVDKAMWLSFPASSFHHLIITLLLILAQPRAFLSTSQITQFTINIMSVSDPHFWHIIVFSTEADERLSKVLWMSKTLWERTSSQASKLRYSETLLTHLLTGVKCRATSVIIIMVNYKSSERISRMILCVECV